MEPPARVRVVLGGFDNTQEMYSVVLPDGRRAYVDEDRYELHQTLLIAQMEGARAADSPVALVLAGGPAAGKTTLLSAVDVPNDAVRVDPDEIKVALPEYTVLSNVAPEWAAAAVHEESSDIARELLRRATAIGANVIVDGTGDGPPGEFVSKLATLYSLGYSVHVVYADAPVDVALARNEERARQTGRLVPPEIVERLHSLVSARFDEVLEHEAVAKVTVYATEGDEGPRMILQKSGTQPIEVVDLPRVQEFVEKGREL